jgi:hypothetical protein
MTDIFALWKTNRFIVADPNILELNEILVLLTDYKFWGHQHIADQNWPSLGAVAHKIKPSIDTMGIDLLREDIRTLEKNGKDSINLEEIPGLMSKVELVINRIFEQIREEMATM